MRLTRLFTLVICLSITLCMAISCGDERSARARKEFDNLVKTFEKDSQAFLALHFDRKDSRRNIDWDVLFYKDPIAYRQVKEGFDMETDEMDSWIREMEAKFGKFLAPDSLDSLMSSSAYYDSIFIFDTGIMDIKEGGYLQKLGYISAKAFHHGEFAKFFHFYFVFDSGWVYVYSKGL